MTMPTMVSEMTKMSETLLLMSKELGDTDSADSDSSDVVKMCCDVIQIFVMIVMCL